MTRPMLAPENCAAPDRRCIAHRSAWRTALGHAGAPGSRLRCRRARTRPSLSAESVRALRQTRAEQHNIFRFYADYLARRRPRRSRNFSCSRTARAASFLRERWPVTVRVAGIGLLLALAAA